MYYASNFIDVLQGIQWAMNQALAQVVDCCQSAAFGCVGLALYVLNFSEKT